MLPPCSLRWTRQMRYDRVMAKSSPDWALSDISMIGTAPIDNTGKVSRLCLPQHCFQSTA